MEASQPTIEKVGEGGAEGIVNEEISQNSPKKRKLTSDVWNDFSKYKGPKGETRARCNHCKRTFVRESNYGTSHLRKHSNGCNAKKRTESKQMMISATKSVVDGGPRIQTFKFDQERSRMDLARMIIKHNYPFNMVEHEFFGIFCNNLQPMFRLVSRNTVRADVISLYE